MENAHVEIPTSKFLLRPPVMKSESSHLHRHVVIYTLMSSEMGKAHRNIEYKTTKADSAMHG